MIGLDEPRLIDTAENGRFYLLSSRSGAQIKLSASAFHLLQAVHNGMSFEDLAERLQRGGGSQISAVELSEAYERVAAEIASIEARRVAHSFPGSGFWGRVRLIPPALVARIAASLKITFHPVIIAILLALMAAGGLVIYAQRIPLHLDSSSWIPTYVLLLLSLLLHELGHATACARFGAEPSEIGFIFYLIYPAFYSDVSSAWQLSRRQRIGVDLGGAYFQLVVAACYGLGYLASGWKPLELAALSIGYGVSFSLNPIFKFDGYWVLADALGVTNLGQQPRRMLSHALARFRGLPVKPLPWKSTTTALLSAYCIASFGVWAIFMTLLLPFAATIFSEYPRQLLQLAKDLLRDRPWGADAASLLGSTVILSFLVITLGRLAMTLAKAFLAGVRSARATTPQG